MILGDLWVGPIRAEEIDRCLLSCFPELNYFADDTDLSELMLASQPQAILILEPLKRLISNKVWQSGIPLIGLGSKAQVFWPELYAPILNTLSAFICLDQAIRPLLPETLPAAKTTVLPWFFAPPRSDKKPEIIFEKTYILDRPWSPDLAKASEGPFSFFIQTAAVRFPYYLERSRSVYLDPAYLNALPFKAAATGAEVFLSKSLSSLLNGQTQSEPVDLAQDYTAFTAQISMDELKTWDIRQTLPKALQELALARLSSKPQVPELTQYKQALLSDDIQAIQYLQAEWQAHGFAAFPEFRLAFMKLLLVHPLVEIDAATLQQQMLTHLEGLEAGLSRDSFDLHLAIQSKDWQKALILIERLLASDFNKWLVATGRQCLQDPLFLEITAVYPLQCVAEIWLRFQQVYCWAHLSHIDLAQSQLGTLISSAYFPAIASFLISLIPHYPEFQPQLEAALTQDPLNMALAQAVLRQRAITAQTIAQKQEVLAQCRHYQSLVRQHMTQNYELEVFLAIESELVSAMGAAETTEPQTYLLWEGALSSFSSLAQINRQWCRHLAANFQISNIPFHPPEIRPDALVKRFETTYSQAADILISHHWPPRLVPPAQGKWAAIIPWEMGQIPQNWVAQINLSMDRVWVPSEFVARSFQQSGVTPSKVAVIPNGVDTQLFQPKGETYPLKTQKTFRFLFVGGTVYRKGIDILLKAYQETFSAQDDVVLVIKSFGADSHYVNQALKTSNDSESPDLLIITEDLEPEALASLYRSCDVYVHPYRGEGFGMPILEAMASGLPVIIPDSGPAPEFAPNACSWQVPGQVVFQTAQDLIDLGPFVGSPYLYEVDHDMLCQTLLIAKTQTEQRLTKAGQGLAQAQAYDWNLIYPRLRAQIQTILKYPLAYRQSASDPVAAAIALQAFQNTGPSDRWLDWFQHSADIDALYRMAMRVCLTEQQPEIWRQAVKAGLSQPIAQVEFSRIFCQRISLPLRVQWLANTELIPDDDKESKILFQAQADFADLSISDGKQAADIFYLLHGSDERADLPFNSDYPIFWTQTEVQRQMLTTLLPTDTDLFCVPMSLDLSAYGSHIPGTILPESSGRFSFLAIVEWEDETAWHQLLRAYAEAFSESQAVNLVLKVLDRPVAQIVPELMDWLIGQGLDPDNFPELTLLQEDLQPELIPGLFRGVQAFIEPSLKSNGLWTLIAQASEIPVIACGPLNHQQSPFTSRFQGGNQAQFVWYLQDAFAHSTPPKCLQIKSQLAVQYDHLHRREHFEDLILRCYMLKQAKHDSG